MCEESVQVAEQNGLQCEIFNTIEQSIDKQSTALAELSYYECIGKDGDIAVPILVVDEYDSFMGAEKFFAEDVLQKLYQLIKEKNERAANP